MVTGLLDKKSFSGTPKNNEFMNNHINNGSFNDISNSNLT